MIDKILWSFLFLAGNLNMCTNDTANHSNLEAGGHNPVLKGLYADPQVLYSEKTDSFYIYPTTDGFKNWNGDYFEVFSSVNLKDWHSQGVILNFKSDISWAYKNAWAPTIIEKKISDNTYKYFFYFTAEKKIGVAVSTHPTGPFIDSGKAIITKFPEGVNRGQNIDPFVFNDPRSGKNYLYWGNYFMAVCELNEDMISIKPNSTRVMIENDEYHSEAINVFYRKGKYYFLWSKNDTRSPDYEVRYVTSDNPCGPINPSESKVILSKNVENGIYSTGHNSVINIPNTDKWYIVYHRFQRPDAINLGTDAGFNREVCIDVLQFDKEGNILTVIPTI